MEFFLKKTAVFLISNIAGGLKFCGQVVGGFFSSFLNSIKIIDYFVIKNFGTPIYKAVWRAKRKIREQAAVGETCRGFTLFAYYFIVGMVVFASSFIFWRSVIRAQPAEVVLEKRAPVFLMSGAFSEEDEWILELPEESVFEGPEFGSYLSEAPVLGYGDASLGVPIDCDMCETFQSFFPTMEDSAFLAPSMALVETEEGKKFRRAIDEYTVRAGDTISSIASKFSLNLNTILWANNLYSWSTIRPGQKFVVPPTDGLIHKVKKGDTVEKLAKQYKVDASQILAFNEVGEDSSLTVGVNLMIPGAKRVYVAPAAPKYVTTPTTMGSLGLFWPSISRRITQYFSWRHSGIDIGALYGSPIYSILDGSIEYAGWGRGYGWQIVVKHDNGAQTRYAHCSQMIVQKGDRVVAGQLIGRVGSTGWSTGPHIHLELYVNGRRVNPLQYLK